jgi:hypothetical protein
MNIRKISKKNREVVVVLSSTELVKICNVFYNAQDEDKNELYFKLYGEMMVANNICQYGLIDDFCFSRVVDCRSIEKSKKK